MRPSVALSFVLAALPIRAQMADLLVPVPAPEPVTPRVTFRTEAGPTETPRPSMLTERTLLDEVTRQVAQHFNVMQDLQITSVRPLKPISVPSSDYTVTVSEFPGQGVNPAFTPVVRVECEGRVVAEFRLPLRAQLWADAWVATSRIEKGQPLDSSAVSTRRIDLLQERQAPLLSDTDLGTMEAAVGIPPGRPLTQQDVAERPLVRKGKVVDVIASRGQLALTMKALALENGTSGALIRLRNIESRKEFSAEVIDENKARVHF